MMVCVCPPQISINTHLRLARLEISAASAPAMR
jgi:hypothetical protein